MKTRVGWNAGWPLSVTSWCLPSRCPRSLSLPALHTWALCLPALCLNVLCLNVLCLTVLCLTVLCLPALAGPRDIASPRPNGWLVDETGTVSASQREAIHRLAERVAERTTGELAVVVVRTTGGMDPRRFATELFNHWGIGSARDNNGILIFAALDDRAAEIVLGSGLSNNPQDPRARLIMDEFMLGWFRRNDPGRAVATGAAQAAAEFLGLELDEADAELGFAEPGSVAPSFIAPDHMARDARPQRFAAPPANRGGGKTGWAWLLAGGAAGVGGSCLGLRSYLRRRARTCPRCKNKMERLGEAEDDQFLESHERKEEHLGSVDYDIWQCPSCEHYQKLSYGAWITRYGRCPGCRARTKWSDSQTIQHATTYSTGTKRVTERCENCDYRRTYTVVIPRRTQSTGSSSSGSSGFGGGRSSGGGASGRW